MVEEKLDLPAPVHGFVHAMNMYNLDGMASRFAPDAIANDQMRHYAGREAIRACLAKEIAGDRGDDVRHRDPAPSERLAVLAKVTGGYDKTGLPDPLERTANLILTFAVISRRQSFDDLIQPRYKID
jgi:hypothetical protein